MLPSYDLPALDLPQLLGQVPISHQFDIEAQIPGSNERADPVAEANLAALSTPQRVKICQSFLNTGNCSRGSSCRFKHSFNKRAKTVVCTHWLRGLCKKDKRCDFLHEYDLTKMSICQFWRDAGECNNPECLYRHVRLAESSAECPYYRRGFCRHGPKCRHTHVRRKACANYIMGFCIDGPNCKFGHPTCLVRPDMPRLHEEISFPHSNSRGFQAPPTTKSYNACMHQITTPACIRVVEGC
jgi:hypothetical protein